MREVRIAEEKKAAFIGEYGAAVLLDYPSSAAKDGSTQVIVELAAMLDAARPDVVYTHNLADKHDTHVAVALRTIAAIRRLPNNTRPAAVYGCEVWRDLDWMADEDKVAFDVTAHSNLAAALMGVYDSQISGGKRYDLATAGRRLAHATFSESHNVDQAGALIYAMDLTPLITDSIDPATHVSDHIGRMEEEISDRIGRLT
jgi:LmbE family N-acetylglucosaminyl deacetylase